MRVLFLFFSLFLASCGTEPTRSSSTDVIISFATNNVATGAVGASGSIPDNIQSVTVEALSPTDTVIAGPVIANRPNFTLKIRVPNGNGIRFRMLAYSQINAAGTVLYETLSAPINLTGKPVTVPVTMNLSVKIAADKTSTFRGGIINLLGKVSGNTPHSSSPLLWTNTGGTLINTDPYGATNIWTAPKTLGNYTITAHIDPNVNPDQDPNIKSSVTISVINREPVVNNFTTSAFSIIAGTTFSTPLFDVSDADGDTFTITAANQPSWAALTQTGTNPTTVTLALSPPATVSGSFDFPMSISDGFGGQLTKNITILVTTISNQPPLITNFTTSSFSLHAATTQSLTLFNVTDPEGDTLSFTSTNKPTWITLNQTGANPTALTMNLTPASTDSGTFTFIINVSDTAGNTVNRSMTVNVVPLPTTPTITYPTNGRVVGSNFTIDGQVASTLTTTIPTSAGVTIDIYIDANYVGSDIAITEGTIAYFSFAPPNTLTNGTHSATAYSRVNGVRSLVSNQVSFTLDTIAPIISLTGLADIYVEINTAYTDQGATWTDNVDGSGSATVTGAVNTAIVGTYTLNYNVSDVAGNAATTVSRNVIIQDSTAPAISFPVSNPYTFAVNEDSYANFTISASDASTPITYSLYNSVQPTNGTVTVNAATGSVSYIGNLNYNNTLVPDSFTVALQDTYGNVTLLNIDPYVQPVNNAPTLTAITAFNAVEDTAYTVSYASLLAASDANDVDGDAILFKLANLPSGTLSKGGVPIFSSKINPVSYAMSNGGGNNVYIDNAYTPGGSATAGVALSGGLGDLTDGLVPTISGPVAPDTTTYIPYVGWNFNPTITFTFATTETIDRLRVLVDNWGGLGIVQPQQVDIIMGGITKTFAIPSHAFGAPLWLDFSGLGLSGTTLDLVLTRTTTNAWVFAAEVEFYNSTVSTLATGESWVYTPPANINGTIPAFSVSAFDGLLPSNNIVPVTFNLTPVNDIPVISLNGLVDEYVTLGSTFTDPGATALDVEDGDISNKITVTGAVNTNAVSVYPLTYHVIDSYGANALAVVRNVHITAPASFTHTWTGAVSTAWNVASNWDVGTVPTVASVVFIPASPVNQPVITLPTSITGINNELGSTLTIKDSSTLTVASGFTNNGTIDLNTTSSFSQPTLTLTAGTLTNAGSITTSGVGTGIRIISAPITNTGTINATQNLRVDGFFSSPAGASSINGNGSTVTFNNGVNIDGLTADNVILVMTLAPTLFDNITFQNYGTTATPLLINYNSTTQTFNNLNYNTALSTGFHMGGSGTGNNITSCFNEYYRHN
ncbi:MAG: DUF5011 domain-containing protein [Ghiorsea sp.]|nr:DUF5011 domain-containing protein [Ghiorsea sp.]